MNFMAKILGRCFRPQQKKTIPLASRSLTIYALLTPLPVIPLAWLILTVQASPQSAKAPEFEKDILPIFQRNCLRCHNTKVKSGGLDLSTSDGVFAGGSSGSAVDPGQPEASRLYEMIHDKKMPLDRRTQVSEAEMKAIRQWIASVAENGTTSPRVVQSSQHDIIPIMLRHCTPCHGVRRREGGLDLRTRALMLQGGKSGAALIPGAPEKSLVLQRILAGEMPPKHELLEGVVAPLSESEIKKLTQWIAQGAPEGNAQPDVAGTEPNPLVTDRDRQFGRSSPAADRGALGSTQGSRTESN
jgi:mono/diheme cytochrome c family protein